MGGIPVERLKAWDILISMDGRGRALDNVLAERLWPTLKDEDIYRRGYDGPTALKRGLRSFIVLLQHRAATYRA